MGHFLSEWPWVFFMDEFMFLVLVKFGFVIMIKP